MANMIQPLMIETCNKSNPKFWSTFNLNILSAILEGTIAKNNNNGGLETVINGFINDRDLEQKPLPQIIWQNTMDKSKNIHNKSLKWKCSLFDIYLFIFSYCNIITKRHFSQMPTSHWPTVT